MKLVDALKFQCPIAIDQSTFYVDKLRWVEPGAFDFSQYSLEEICSDRWQVQLPKKEYWITFHSGGIRKIHDSLESARMEEMNTDYLSTRRAEAAHHEVLS